MVGKNFLIINIFDKNDGFKDVIRIRENVFYFFSIIRLFVM